MAKQNRWTVEQAAKAMYALGQGKSAQEIASSLGEGVTAGAVRQFAYRNELKSNSKFVANIQLAHPERRQLAKRAKALGIASEEYLRRIAVCAIEDDLYVAVTDGRFD